MGLPLLLSVVLFSVGVAVGVGVGIHTTELVYAWNVPRIAAP